MCVNIYPTNDLSVKTDVWDGSLIAIGVDIILEVKGKAPTGAGPMLTSAELAASSF